MNRTRQGGKVDRENIKSTRSKRRKFKINSKDKLITSTVILIATIVFVICAIKLIYWLSNNKHSADITKELIKTIEIKETPGNVTEKINAPLNNTSSYENDYFYYMSLPFMSVDFTTLTEKNTDTVAWLKVPGTNVNYPVVQTTNNEYYLTHAFDKSKNTAGWIFADYRCNFQDFGRNNIIYGHSRRNNTMFGSLLLTLNKSWYENKDNTVIHLSTPKYNTIWQVFSVYQIEKESEYLTTYFDTDDMYLIFLNKMKDRSIYKFNCELDSKDSILTLSTCAKNDNNRVIIHAKLIKREIR